MSRPGTRHAVCCLRNICRAIPNGSHVWKWSESSERYGRPNLTSDTPVCLRADLPLRRGQVHPVYGPGVNRTHEFFEERQLSIIKWSQAMLSKTRIALSFAIICGAGSCASAAVTQEASNHASQYSNPADTPNGPFFY